MSLRTAREWDAGPVPSATKQLRDWRTRPDPFADVWRTDVEPLLRSDTRGILEAKVMLELLRTRYPEQFHPGQARTLQRRFRDWRAHHGPEPEVFFEQVAVPGREAAIDFTPATDLGVIVAGDLFPHLLFHFQWLTENIGDPRLREHLWKVIGIMQVFENWDQFYVALNRILPPFSDEPLLAIAEGQNPYPETRA